MPLLWICGWYLPTLQSEMWNSGYAARASQAREGVGVHEHDLHDRRQSRSEMDRLRHVDLILWESIWKTLTVMHYRTPGTFSRTSSSGHCICQ